MNLGKWTFLQRCLSLARIYPPLIAPIAHLTMQVIFTRRATNFKSNTCRHLHLITEKTTTEKNEISIGFPTGYGPNKNGRIRLIYPPRKKRLTCGISAFLLGAKVGLASYCDVFKIQICDFFVMSVYVVTVFSYFKLTPLKYSKCLIGYFLYKLLLF